MPFTFLRFRASPSIVAVTSRCSDLPCGPGPSVDLVADLEVSGNPRFDVNYAITHGDARFCRNGASEITISGLSGTPISEEVKFCRGAEMSPGYDSITILATIRERGGSAQSRDTVITVRPLHLVHPDESGPDT